MTSGSSQTSDTVVGFDPMEVITDIAILSRQSLGRLESSICMYKWMLCEREHYVEQPNDIITQPPSLSSLHLVTLTSPLSRLMSKLRYFMWSQNEHTTYVSALLGNRADMALIIIIAICCCRLGKWVQSCRFALGNPHFVFHIYLNESS